MAVYRQGILILRNLISQTSTISRTESRNIKRWVSPTLRELKRRKDRLGTEVEIPKSSFLEWNYSAEIYAFGKRINENFDKSLLQNALTNRSFIIQEESRQQAAGIENPNIHIEDNHQLISEGEDFINKCVREQLQVLYPKFPMEGIQSVCSHLTSNNSLANIAIYIGLKDIILCAEYPPSEPTLSCTFKAVIASLMQSSGKARASNFIYEFVILKQLANKDINEMWDIKDPLQMLRTITESEIEPRICNYSGGNTVLSAYQIGLYVNKNCIGLGWGESIDIAIDMAARDGLKRLFNTLESRPAINNIHFNISSSNKYSQVNN